MKLLASTPYRSHVYRVASFDRIKEVQQELILQMCAAVSEQMGALSSGEEGQDLWTLTLCGF